MRKPDVCTCVMIYRERMSGSVAMVGTQLQKIGQIFGAIEISGLFENFCKIPGCAGSVVAHRNTQHIVQARRGWGLICSPRVRGGSGVPFVHNFYFLNNSYFFSSTTQNTAAVSEIRKSIRTNIGCLHIHSMPRQLDRWAVRGYGDRGPETSLLDQS